MLKQSGFETYMTGDCWRAGRIVEAICDGLRLGCMI